MNSMFLLKLRELGCDVDGAVERCGDDEAFYIQCLQMTMEDDGLRLLGEALDREDAQFAFEHAHTLKGVWANVGLTKLYEMIFPMVESLRAGNAKGLQEDYDKITREYETIRQLIIDNIDK